MQPECEISGVCVYMSTKGPLWLYVYYKAFFFLDRMAKDTIPHYVSMVLVGVSIVEYSNLLLLKDKAQISDHPFAWCRSA